MSTDRVDHETALRQTFAQLEHQLRQGRVARRELPSVGKPVVTDTISTGSMMLDAALGIGGLPRGRITEIYGSEASGKTTLALHIIAESQKSGGLAAFIDAEHALDAMFARKLGVDTHALLVSQPDTGEQALAMIDILVRSGALDVVVIDSAAALVPKIELDSDLGSVPTVAQARFLSQGLRPLTATVRKSRTSVIFLNQIRQKIGTVTDHLEVTTGGNALTHAASVRLDVRRLGTIPQQHMSTGSRTRVRVVKNKLALPFRQAEFDILYDQGISHLGELLDLGVTCGLIVRQDGRFVYEHTRLGQDRAAAIVFLNAAPQVVEPLEMQIRQRLGLPASPPVETSQFGRKHSFDA